MSEASHTFPLGLAQIKTLIPHREPFLFVNEIMSLTNKQLRARTAFPISNPMFLGHFPGNPVVPGVIMLEAMAQAAAVFTSLSKGLTNDSVRYLFAGAEVRFKRPIKPDEIIDIVVDFTGERRQLMSFSCTAMVGQDVATTAMITAHYQII
jgi:3-hydroxyacyl-[acyl-carrier-protein] dehydratase